MLNVNFSKAFLCVFFSFLLSGCFVSTQGIALKKQSITELISKVENSTNGKTRNLALSQLIELADSGDDLAQTAVGKMFFHGIGNTVPRMHKLAYGFLKNSAEKGDLESIYFLGTIFTEGEGVKKDYQRASNYFLLAAEKGHVKSQSSLAFLYKAGWGVIRNPGKAYYWYSIAAEKGNVTAQEWLGVLYARGSGVKKNQVEAYKWLTIANAKRPANTNAAMLHRLSKEMTKEQVKLALKKAQNWHSSH